MPARALPNSTAVTVQSLGSGSSGNAFLVEYDGKGILLDCGVGIRTLTRALHERRRRIADLHAILVTHEHGDHIRTLPRFVGMDVPVVSTRGTKRYLPIPDAQWQSIAPDAPVSIAGVTVWAIGVEHDAAEPCGYLIEAGTSRVSIFTDLGCWHDRLAEPIAASDLVVLEANHDEEMLRRGPYPIHLKRRVASAKGHLSNIDCGVSLATTLRASGTAPEIWLAHLSNTNNTPAVAHETVTSELAQVGIGVNVTSLPRTAPGPVWRGRGGPERMPWEPANQPDPVAQLTFDFSG